MQPQGERERDSVGGILTDLPPAGDQSRAHGSGAALIAGFPAPPSLSTSGALTSTTTAVTAAAAAAASNTATNNNGVLQMNLDHYKYLRTLLPTIPHVIDSLSVSDANSWECTIYAALLTESDCLKWLMEFQDNTKTDWKAEIDNELLAATERHKQVGVVNYGKVYRCVGSAYQDAGGEELIRKKCPAKMEIKILNAAEVERKGKSKQYPCQVHISFYHNHTLSMTINGGLLSASVCSATATAVAEFKVQQQLLDQATTSSTLKDQYEYFLPNNNIGDAVDQATAAVNLSAIQPPPPHHHHGSQRRHHLQQQEQHQPLTVILPQQSHQQQLHPTTYQAPPATVVFDLEDVSKKLDCILSMLKLMLKKTGTSCAAVKQFTDHFDSLKGDEEALETALCNFGRTAAAAAASSATAMTLTTLEASQVPLVPSTVTTAAAAASSLMGQEEQMPATISTPHWTMTPVLPQDQDGSHIEGDDAAGRDEISNCGGDVGGDAKRTAAEAQLSSVGVGVAVSDAVAKTLNKLKTNRRKPKTAMSGVLPGMIDPVTGKRRKRSRCGTCLGCMNRDKTQDCRVCRNCIDQKRYGGPGRLKKACVKRSCIIMATQEGLEPIPAKSALKTSLGSSSSTVSSESPPVQDQQLLDGTTITLPIHPLPVTTAPPAPAPAEAEATSARPVATVTLPQQPVTLAVRTTAAGSQLAASAPRRTMAIPSTSTSATTEATPAAVLSWPNGTAFAPTFQVRMANECMCLSFEGQNSE